MGISVDGVICERIGVHRTAVGLQVTNIPYPSWIPWDPNFWKGYQFCSITCCFGNEFYGLVDCSLEIEPDWFVLCYCDLDGRHCGRGEGNSLEPVKMRFDECATQLRD